MNGSLFRRVCLGRMLLKSILATASEMAIFFTFSTLPFLRRQFLSREKWPSFPQLKQVLPYAIFAPTALVDTLVSSLGFVISVTWSRACSHSRTLSIASSSEIFLTSTSFFFHSISDNFSFNWSLRLSSKASPKLQCLACFLSGPGTCRRILLTVAPCGETRVVHTVHYHRHENEHLVFKYKLYKRRP